MRGHQAKADRRTSGGAEQRSEAHVAARAGADAGPANGASDKSASLLQLQRALDQSPKVQAQVALQRALDKQAAGGKAPAKKKTATGKPALQKKGIAINDDVGLEREADVMGARAATASPVQRVASGTVIQREPFADIAGVRTDLQNHSIEQLQELLTSGQVYGKAYDVVKARISQLEEWSKDKKKEAGDTKEDTSAAGKERAEWVNPLLAMKNHIAGEIKGGELKGGHLLTLMQETHKKPKPALIVKTPPADQGVSDCVWTLPKGRGKGADVKNSEYPPKTSTMFPKDWTWDTLTAKLNASHRVSGHIVLPGDIGLHTPGDTFYPEKSGTSDASASESSKGKKK
jgi:hypothetical protein